MAEASTLDATVADVLAQLAALEDPKMRAVNERHGDDHGVNLTKLRAVAKALKTNHDLALELWATDDTAARLVAILICKPKLFAAAELDAMLREARAAKVHDWLVNYIVAVHPAADELRTAWLADEDPVVASAGWTLTSIRISKNKADGIDETALLDEIEAEMRDADKRLQWEMNRTLAEIGIANRELRPRALDIGERLEVLKDYPTPKGCTSPFAPAWIGEIVRRREG